jgi:hypothetical protein
VIIGDVKILSSPATANPVAAGAYQDLTVRL